MEATTKRAVRSTGIYLLGAIAERGALFLILPILTRHLTAYEYGTFALLTVIGSAINCLVYYPVAVAAERYFYEPHYQGLRGSFVTGLLTILIGKALIAAAVFWCLSEQIGALLTVQGESISVSAYSAVVALSPVALLSVLLLQLSQRAATCVFATTFGICTGSAVSIFLLIGCDFGFESLVIGQIVQHALVTALLSPHVVRLAGSRFRWDILAAPLRWAYSLLPAAYSDLVVQSGDRYLLAGFCGPAAVGVYDLGCRVSSVITLLLSQPVKRSLAPIILQMENDPVRQRRFISDCATWFYLLGLVLAVTLATFAREIIVLLAPDRSYWAAWTIVPITVFASVQHGAGQFFNYGLVMARRGGIDSGCLLVSAAANVALNLVLIPWLGIVGAALSTLGSLVIWNGLKIHFSRRLYGITFDLRRIGHATFLAATMIGIATFLELTVGSTFQFTPGVKLCCVVGFPATLLLTGFLTTAESGIAGQMVNRLFRKLIKPNRGAAASPTHREAAVGGGDCI